MINVIAALMAFIAILSGIALFYSRLGNFSFWKLVSYFPDEAFDYMSQDPAWYISESDKNKAGDFVGPFSFYVPRLGRMIKLYAQSDQIKDSEQRFIDLYRSKLPKRGVPYLSFLALLYPVASILSIGSEPVPILLILGYGIANLGYLLAFAFLYPGHFYALGLENRPHLFFAAGFFLLFGFLLSNIN